MAAHAKLLTAEKRQGQRWEKFFGGGTRQAGDVGKAPGATNGRLLAAKKAAGAMGKTGQDADGGKSGRRHSAGDGEKAAGAGADTRQAMSERRRAPGEHGGLLTAEIAADAGANTRQAMSERRRAPGEHGGLLTAEKRQTPGPTHSWRCRNDGGRGGRITAGADGGNSGSSDETE